MKRINTLATKLRAIAGRAIAGRAIAVMALVVLALPLPAQDLAFIPLDSPLYQLLDNAWAGGYLDYLPQMRPYTRKQASQWAAEIEATQAPVWLKAAISAELAGGKPLLGLSTGLEDGGRLDFNNQAAIDFAFDAATPQDLILKGSWISEINIGLGQYLFLGVNQNFSLSYYSWVNRPSPRYQKQDLPDVNLYTYYLDTGGKNFNHDMKHEPGAKDFSLTAGNTMQFNIDLPFGLIQSGRQSLDWGPSPYANLALSRTSHPYDYMGYRFDLGRRGSFAWMTGVLQPIGFSTTNKLVSAHKLEYQLFPWLQVALYEAVLYPFRIELAYLNPLSVYYIAEVNKGSTDNKLGGMDLVARFKNTKAYLSLYADDWDFDQLFSFNYFHNIWAGILGFSNYSLPGLHLNGELVYLSHWMYTHWQPGLNYTHWNQHLGHPLEPTSWMLRGLAEYRLDDQWQFSLGSWIAQKGRGSIDTTANWAAESELYGVPLTELFYSFLDKGKAGIVIETSWSLALGASYRPLKVPLRMTLDWSMEHSANAGNVEGAEVWNHYLRFGITL